MKTQLNTLLSRGVLIALSLSVSATVSAKQIELIATPKDAVISKEMLQQNNGSRTGLKTLSAKPVKFIVEEQDVDSTIAELMATGDYIAVEQDSPIMTPDTEFNFDFSHDYKVEGLTYDDESREFDGDVPNDPLFYIQSQWEDRTESTPDGMGFTRAWNLVDSKQRVVVAVIDGGFGAEGYSADFTPIESVSVLYRDNVETNGIILNSRPGDSAYSTDEEISCEKSHGLGVAGVATANTNNDNQIAGIADNAYVDTIAIQAVVCDTGLMSEMAKGIRLAAGGAVEGIGEAEGVEPLSVKADIINVSLASKTACSTYTQSAIDFARSQGAIVIAAAGNSSEPVSDYSPANCEGVITVGAGTSVDDDLASFSNYGSGLDIVAGGTSIVTLGIYGDPDSSTYGVGKISGTSIASPIVAGTLAMAKTTSPSMSYEDMLALLQLTSTPMSGDTCNAVGCEQGTMHAERFMLAVRGVEDGNAGVIMPALLAGESCNPELYTMIDAVKARLCESTTVTLTNLLSPKYEAPTVRFMASPAMEELTAENGQILYEGEEFTFPISGVEFDDVSFGYQLCHSGECEDFIFPVELDLEGSELCN